MSRMFDPIRPMFHALRRAGIDIQSPRRRDALNALTVQRRLLAGRPVRTVLDCGAHHGRVAREYLKAFPEAHVHSFEPTPTTFDTLRANLAAHDRAHPVHAAVGDTEGQMTFYLAPFEQANSLLPRHPGNPEKEQTVQVPVRRLDRYCAEVGIREVDILKLDVEGYEGPALRGCGELLDQRRVGIIYAETRFDGGGGANTTFPDLCALLMPRGYQFYGLYDPRHDETLKFEWGDVMFVSPSLAPRTAMAS